MKAQNGNALFLILIAVALFAALSYAVTQSGRGGGNVDRETLLIETAQLIQYIGSINQAVQRLQLVNGCSDIEISLLYDSDEDGTVETNGDDEFFNPNAPADGSCNVFSSNGGAITYIRPSDVLRDISQLVGADLSQSGNIIFTGENQHVQIGTDGVAGASNDLSLVVPFMSQEACNQINQSLGISGTDTQDTDVSITLGDATAFTGSYPTGAGVRVVGDEVNGTDLVGQAIACLNETSEMSFHLYSVLIER